MKMLPRRRSVVPAYRIQGCHIVASALDAPKVVESLRSHPVGYLYLYRIMCKCHVFLMHLHIFLVSLVSLPLHTAGNCIHSIALSVHCGANTEAHLAKFAHTCAKVLDAKQCAGLWCAQRAIGAAQVGDELFVLGLARVYECHDNLPFKSVRSLYRCFIASVSIMTDPEWIVNLFSFYFRCCT